MIGQKGGCPARFLFSVWNFKKRGTRLARVEYYERDQPCCSFLLSILRFAYSVSGIYVHARDCVAYQERQNQTELHTFANPTLANGALGHPPRDCVAYQERQNQKRGYTHSRIPPWFNYYIEFWQT